MAQDAAVIETQLVAEVRVSADAQHSRDAQQFVPATVLAQGDVVHYTVRIRNTSTVYAHDVEVTQRVPANTTYVAGSATGPAAEVSFSTDGGQTFAAPHELLDDGTQRAATADRYTHIRWRLRYPLAPGAVALARFDAVFK